ncbi:MAG: type II toxin-antitoxin system HicB family antitoxin [Nostocales cyanobacterium 94392]|nr:type II toxin-antitoxin system HicB family antitoxin [Nostocales cyanobacterium 94392]
MEFYTVILRESAGYCVALCLENGIVGQGDTQENAISKLKEAIECFEEVYNAEENIHQAAIPIDELHEFEQIEEMIEDYVLVKLMKEVEGEETLSKEEALKYLASLETEDI